MSTCDISKYELSISIFEHFMTKFHELPEQPSYFAIKNILMLVFYNKFKYVQDIVLTI